MTEKRVTNLILAEKIDALDKGQKELREYIKDCYINNKREIENNRNDVKSNAIAIAGMKGASGVIAVIVSAISTAIISLLLTKNG